MRVIPHPSNRHPRFDRRKTHDLPEALERPPESWKERYRAMARECGISEELAEAFDALSDYFYAVREGPRT